VLPELLDGYFWFTTNSLLEVPWFTPSLCGGQPYFADVQSFYYSVAQFLTFFFNPLTAVYLSILVFASLGFWGMYLLLRQIFKTSEESAFLAASLFMFNGFYNQRMMVGHITFEGFMLIPLIGFLLLSSDTDQEKARFPSIFKASVAGVLVAYWLQSGLTSLIIPAALTVLAIASLHAFGDWKVFLYRSFGAMLVVLMLSAAKLAAGFAFMAHFTRSNYLLPGFNGLWIELKLLFSVLFFPTSDIEKTAFANMSHMQWVLNHHEWEFGITFIPLLIILLMWGQWLWKPFKFSAFRLEKQSVLQWIGLVLLMMILIFPIALNFYTVEWNAVLKQTPLIKSSSTLTRWWLIYVPMVIIYAGLSLDKLTFLEKYRKHFVTTSVIIIIILNLTQDRMYYDAQNYNGNTILEAYETMVVSNTHPEIHSIQLADPHATGNDLLTLGMSQLGCYNPSFGYRLENLPFKTLHPGSIFEQTNGYLNLKNPACYLFPEENNCRPGDHFKISQKAQAQLFAHYQPFAFEVSLKQKIANLITQLGLLFVVFVFGFAIVYYVKSMKHQ
jgi:hypothetical protein